MFLLHWEDKTTTISVIFRQLKCRENKATYRELGVGGRGSGGNQKNFEWVEKRTIEWLLSAM